MEQRERVLLAVLSVFLLGVYYMQERAHAQTVQVSAGVVTRVVDGDTVMVQSGKREQRVRLLGINAPEVKTKECYSAEATDALRLLVEGKKVVLRREGLDKDTYGRLLRFVYVNGSGVNEVLVLNGFARVFPVQAFAAEQRYRAFEKEAQRARRGMWGACVGIST